MICTVCSLRFSMTVVAWMHMKAVNTIWKWSSANVFWIHYLAGFWIPMPSIRDSTSKNFLDSGIRITLHGAICEIWWPDSTLSLSDLMTEQHPKLLAKTGVVRWLDLWSLFQLDKLVHKAPVLTCSSICTKRFYELWRCAALSSIFKSSFSSNAICIVMVKWIFSFVLFLLKALLPPFSRVWVRPHFPNSFRVSPRR